MSKIKNYFFLSLLLPLTCFAHPNHLGYQGFEAGFLHPLTGMDHALAMIAVGLIASQKNKRWLYPAVFVGMMIMGGVIGALGVHLSLAELGITLSVLVLGLCASFPNHLPSIFLLILIGSFALCHGFAHGAEMPATVSIWQYALGFMSATLALQLLAMRVGLFLIPKQTWILRAMGMLLAACTFWI
ncbi:MAG: HupE/UreJ family protein [Proteobacteria bacterium]|nr:HupE/UreJ family protein [Pseudomonadota bacterium]